MTIYLPYPDYRRSAKCLTDDHLKEQRNFIREAIRTLIIPGRLSKALVNVAVWEGHMTSLLQLCEATLDERRRRKIDERGVTPWMLDHEDPPLMFDKAFHDGMKRVLLKANPLHYGRMGWRV